MRKFVILAIAACGGGGSSDTVTVTAPHAPSAIIAFRDGDEPFETRSAEAAVTFPVISGRYTVVVACPTDGIANVVAYLFTVENTRELVHDHWCNLGERSISGTIANSTGLVTVGWGESLAGFDQNTYTIPVGGGTSELFAVSFPLLDADRGVIRSLEVDNDVAGQDLDLSGPDSFAFDAVSLGFAPDNSAHPITANTILSRASGMRVLTSTVIADSGVVRVLPAGIAAADDMYLVSAGKTSGDPTSNRLQPFSGVEAVTRMPTANMIGAPPQLALSMPIISMSDGAELLVEAQWDVPGHHQMRVQQAGVSWRVHASPEFRAEQSLAIPDLAGVAGWPDIGLEAQISTDVLITAMDFDSQELARDYPTRERLVDFVGWGGGL